LKGKKRIEDKEEKKDMAPKRKGGSQNPGHGTLIVKGIKKVRPNSSGGEENAEKKSRNWVGVGVVRAT